MPDYHVKNNSPVDKAFKVRGGHTVVPAGGEADVVDARDLTEAQINALSSEGINVKAVSESGKASRSRKAGRSGAPEMAEMHRMLDASQEEVSSLKGRVAELEEQVQARDDEIAALKGGEGDAGSAAQLEAKHRGGGSYSIMRGDEEIAEKLTKQDAEAFNAMSDEDKIAYVEAAKK